MPSSATDALVRQARAAGTRPRLTPIASWEVAETITRASALRSCAAAVASRSRPLCSASAALRATAMATRTCSAAARRERAWRPVPAWTLSEGREAGRLTLPAPDRRRRAAAFGSLEPGDAPRRPRDEDKAAGAGGTQWAHAPVYATRLIDGVPRAHLGDEEGTAFESWTIRELDTRDLRGARGARCLVFENHAMVRRVWSYPPDWASLPAEALLRLAGIWP